ncbi:hypothetical protein SLEP1_g22362 [Rubroshorea leprosula]|uniref:Uncharacterized protein n=1 Tax=Rubroshorea leprosula TaxID=152421 RepID=A0AAV5JIA8_9ROSI|nr:hypothetical protein SLEP1_g22362 [Rubroshorea leprosula]
MNSSYCYLSILTSIKSFCFFFFINICFPIFFYILYDPFNLI